MIMEPTNTFDIQEISRRVAPIARQFGVAKVSLLGSRAYDTPTDSSDLDFRIVDRGTLCGLIDPAGFQLALEDSFSVPVNLLTDDILSDDFLARIAPYEVTIYEH
jgi:predicted nucleotidyltransferase